MGKSTDVQAPIQEEDESFSLSSVLGKSTDGRAPIQEEESLDKTFSDFGELSSLLAQEATPTASGSFCNIFIDSDPNIIVKKLKNEYLEMIKRHPEKLKTHLQRIVTFHKTLQSRGFHLAPIVNADTAANDGVIKMPKLLECNETDYKKAAYQEFVRKHFLINSRLL